MNWIIMFIRFVWSREVMPPAPKIFVLRCVLLANFTIQNMEKKEKRTTNKHNTNKKHIQASSALSFNLSMLAKLRECFTKVYAEHTLMAI